MAQLVERGRISKYFVVNMMNRHRFADRAPWAHERHHASDGLACDDAMNRDFTNPIANRITPRHLEIEKCERHLVEGCIPKRIVG